MMSVCKSYCTAAILSTCMVAAPVAANAGGYVSPAEPTPVIASSPQVAPTWQGFYAGLGLGAVFGGDDRVGISRPRDTLIFTPGSIDLNGLTYGIHAGYRWQTAFGGRTVVVGPEISYETGKAEARGRSVDGSTTASTKMNSFMALRVKAGTVINGGQGLLYGTLGYGRGDFDYDVRAAGMDFDGGYTDNAWIVGFGAERKINERTSVFGEWEFRGFGKTELIDARGFSTQATPEHHHLKFGVNISF